VFITALLITPVLAALTLAVVLSRPDPRKSPTADWTPVASPTQTQGPLNELKQPIVGLLDRNRAPAVVQRDSVKAHVVDVSWAELQPAAGGPIVRDNAIDRAVTVAQRDGLQLKLRVRAGIDAPPWAKTIGGAPITIRHTDNNPTQPGSVAGTIGRFWLPAFSAAYAGLQSNLAAIYDNVPEIRQTDVSQCSTIYSETYLRGLVNPDNVSALRAGGYTRAADEQCHLQQLNAHRVWTHTLSDVAFNPFTTITPAGTVQTDLAYALDQMSVCRSVLGERCVLQNNSIASSRLYGGSYRSMYDRMRSLGGAIDFQTAMPSLIGDHNEVLAWAADICASSVELPNNYPTWPDADLDQALNQLRLRTGCPAI